MESKRMVGVLERFSLKPGEAHAYVRVEGNLVHVPMVNRGVLQPGNIIAPCVNGARYAPLLKGGSIALDIMLDREGKNPYAVRWAPVIKNKEGPPK